MKLRKLASNTSYLAIDWVLITALSSLFWIILGKLLGAAELGIVSTTFNFASILQFIATLGIGFAVSKLISEYSQNGHEDRIGEVVGPAIKILIISNLIVSIFVFTLSQSISPIIKLSSQLIFIAIIIGLLLSFSNVAGYVLIGFQNMRRLMHTNIVYHTAKVLASIIFIFFGFGFLGPLFGIVVGLFLLNIIRINLFKYIGANGRSDYKLIFHYAVPSFLGGIASLAFNNVPYITLTVIKDLSITGLFTPAMLLATPLFIFPALFSTALFPIVSGMSRGRQKVSEKSLLINLALRYTIFLVLPLALFLTLFPEQIILILFKPEYLPSAELLRMLSLGALFQGISGIFLNSLFALKRPKIQQNILIFTAVMFTTLSIPLTYYLSATGMSVSYILATFTMFVLSLFYLRKLVKINLPIADISKIFVASAIFAMFVFILKPYVQSPAAILLFLPAVAVYLVTLLILRFYSNWDLKLIEFLWFRAPIYLKPFLKIASNLIKSSLPK